MSEEKIPTLQDVLAARPHVYRYLLRTPLHHYPTRVPFANTQAIMRRYLDDFVLVSDAAIQEAILLLLQHTHNLAEGAGAAATAAAVQLAGRLAGKKVALVLSGGNLAPDQLQMILAKERL